MKYVYPAIFTKENNGYSICFPNFESCYTSAETLSDGMEMAKDVLCLTLYDLEERGEAAPPASDISALTCGENEFATLINCDTIEYRRFYDNKAVKKTLTIPAWLNTMAEREEINFSQILQNALKEALHLS